MGSAKCWVKFFKTWPLLLLNSRIGGRLTTEKLVADEDKSKSWWHTLPGVITSVAAAITAVAGLIAAVKQTGWLESGSVKATAVATAPPSTAPTSNSGPVTTGTQSVAVEVAETSVIAGSNSFAVNLPAVRDYRMQRLDGTNKAIFTVLKAELLARNADTKLLKVRVRVLNEDRYPMNFWGDSFRLVIDGAPRQPDQSPNEVLPPNAAQDADLIFAVPREVQRVKLRLLHAEEITDIALNFGAAR
jgi:hypothetical protein